MSNEKEKFAHFLTLCDDYETAKLAFSTAERAAEAIRAAVGERIEADRTQTAERLAELERLTADISRPTSARRVWKQELDRLKARTFSATAEEKAAFDVEMSEAQEAIRDMVRLQGRIREEIGGVGEAIRELRSKTLGDPYTGLWENHLDGVRKRFAPFCQEVRA